MGCSIRASRLSLVGDSLEGVPLSDSSVAALNGIVTRAPLWSCETLRGRYTGNANRREPATKKHLATGGVDQKQPTLCPSDITNREPLLFGSAPHRWGRRQSAPRLTVIRDTRAVRPSCLSRTTRLPFESLLFRYTTLRMFVFFPLSRFTFTCHIAQLGGFTLLDWTTTSRYDTLATTASTSAEAQKPCRIVWTQQCGSSLFLLQCSVPSLDI